jgi:hypothetical protein
MQPKKLIPNVNDYIKAIKQVIFGLKRNYIYPKNKIQHVTEYSRQQNKKGSAKFKNFRKNMRNFLTKKIYMVSIRYIEFNVTTL